MATICIQCSLRALLAGEQCPVFNESPEAHQRLCHPDLTETARERRDLERQLLARHGNGGPATKKP